MENSRISSDGALEYKLLVLGCSQVGKTSLIRRYTAGKFPSGMMATVGKRQLQILLCKHAFEAECINLYTLRAI